MTIASGGGGPPAPAILPRSLLAADTLEAARHLLGARLVRELAPRGDEAVAQRIEGRIVEVEAYLGPDDRASHARMGPTPRNRVMFGPAGHAYVYLVYGMHHCLNVVTGPAGFPAAVLVRAVEPVNGLAAMRTQREGRHPEPVHPAPDHRLAAGPGLVGSAFGLDRSWTGLDLCDPASPLRIEPAPPGEAPPLIEAGPRIGIDYAGRPWTERPWRLVDARSRSLSRPIRRPDPAGATRAA